MVTTEKGIEKLAGEILALHSFEYRSLKEAQKTVSLDGLWFTFDALSLCVYNHNLPPEKCSMLYKYLSRIWNTKSADVQKERLERAILFHYLNHDKSLYKDYTIEKTLHPDFILKGEQHIGLEVTQLTTPTEKVMAKISQEQFGQGKNAEQIKAGAIAKHGKKAEHYSYIDLGKTQTIGSPAFDISTLKKCYANQIIHKFHKYQPQFSQFDVFIILADGQHGLGLTSESDLDDIYNMIKNEVTEINKVKIAILWNNGSNGFITEY